jgi:hypothetical protein
MTDSAAKLSSETALAIPDGPCQLERASSDSCMLASSSDPTNDNALTAVHTKKNRKRTSSALSGCLRCEKKRNRRTEPSAWMQFLKKFQLKNPGMSVGESQIQARKLYIPKNGRMKSYERVFREFWRAKNPSHKELYPGDEGKARMRTDFLDKLV